MANRPHFCVRVRFITPKGVRKAPKEQSRRPGAVKNVKIFGRGAPCGGGSAAAFLLRPRPLQKCNLYLNAAAEE